MVKLLFVCTGNICRSPTAAGVMRAHVAKAGLQDAIAVDSAGTHGYHVGEPPDRRSIATALKYRIDISDLRARQVCADDFTSADLILAMDRGHHAQLLALCPPDRRDRIRLFMSFAAGAGPVDVPDPYYGDDGFDTVFEMIERGAQGLLDHLRRSDLAGAATGR